MELSNTQLQLFCDLAEELNFSRVARRHHLSQPAVSARLKQIESSLGVRLLERMPRHVALTKEGALILPYVRDLLFRCHKLKEVIAQAQENPAGEIRIAATYSLGMYELPQHLSAFLTEFPDVHVDVHYRPADMIYELLQEKKIDLGLVPYPQSSAKVEIRSLGEDRFVLVVPLEHRLARKRTITLSQIAGEHLITFGEGTKTAEAIDAILRGAEVTVARKTPVQNIDTLKRTVEAKRGIAILPAQSVVPDARDGKLKVLEINDLSQGRPFGIVFLKDRPMSTPENLLLEIISGGARKPKKRVSRQQTTVVRPKRNASSSC